MTNSSSQQEKSNKLHKFWKAHINRWAGSGVSQREYCRQQGIKPNRFTYWKTKFQRQGQGQAMELVQVPAPTDWHDSGLKLNLGQGLQIEIPDGFSCDTLERVLMTLRIVS